MKLVYATEKYNHMKDIQYKKLFGLILILFFSINVFSQSAPVTVAGSVVDKAGNSIPGTTIFVKNAPGTGTVSDINGNFTIKVAPNNILVFTFVGFKKQEYLVLKAIENLKMVMAEDQEQLDEVVVVGQGEQRKVSVIGAISTIDPELLAVPANSVTNMLGGRVPGIIARQLSGEPGNDFSEFWIRGISTFGANSSALVLIDGVEGNLNDIDPSDIESFSVLKDASATAVYGNRGANGVVLVQTKQGKEGKLNVSFKNSVSMSYSPRMPDYLDAYDYASMANEARSVRGLKSVYDDVELNIIRDKLDPDLYPNVNWQDEILKKNTWYNQHYLSVSGGGSNARYFISAGLQNKSGIFKEEGMQNYNTNVRYKKYTFRANVMTNLTKTTELSLSLDGTIVRQNSPGHGTNNDDIWRAQANLTPITVPVRYSNGMLPSYGSAGNQMSPYVLLNHTGFKTYNRNSMKVRFQVNQDLKFITEGLKVNGFFNFSSDADHDIYRRKVPELFRAIARGNSGELIMQKTVSAQSLSFDKFEKQSRQFYFETNLNWARTFGDHRASAMVHYYMEDNQVSDANDEISSIPKRYLGLSGRLTYSFQDIYFVEGNFGYTGSENFRVGEQYGFFPAVSVGWLPTNYEWVKNNIPVLSHFKVKASYGQVGNDKIADIRFPYFTFMNWNGDVAEKWGSSGITEGQIGASNLQWEVANKYNLGFEVKLFDDKLAVNFDIYKDVRDGIFQPRYSMPQEVGVITKPYVNIGKMNSSGFEGDVSYTQKIPQGSVTIRGNMTYAKNKLINYEEPLQIYPYKYKKGYTYNTQRGLIALGLFRDSTDILKSPRQTYGEVRPGDIKYKDINGDGKIDDDDVVPLSFNSVPEFQYGFAGEVSWKNWTFSVWFKGASRSTFFKGGTGWYPFVGGEVGNVLSVAKGGGHWTPAWYSGDPSTENPNALFPRLTYGNSANNNRASSFYMANGRYLKLQNVTISYRYQAEWMKKLGMRHADVQLIGDNLACWDDVKLWDPEQASGNGAVYPLQRKFSLQVDIAF